HWRIIDRPGDVELERELWEGARSFPVLGQQLLVPSPEIALAHSITHGFRNGSRADLLQTVIDSVRWLRDCSAFALRRVLSWAGLNQDFQDLRSVLAASGVEVPFELESESPTLVVEMNKRRHFLPALDRLQVRRASRVRSARLERQLLRWPRFYQAWEAIG